MSMDRALVKMARTDEKRTDNAVIAPSLLVRLGILYSTMTVIEGILAAKITWKDRAIFRRSVRLQRESPLIRSDPRIGSYCGV
jgi:hypothetical protein